MIVERLAREVRVGEDEYIELIDWMAICPDCRVYSILSSEIGQLVRIKESGSMEEYLRAERNLMQDDMIHNGCTHRIPTLEPYPL